MQTKVFFEVLLLGCLWGPSFLFIKVACAELPIATFVAGRVALAAAILYGVLKCFKRRLPTSKRVWGHLLVTGFLSGSLPFLLFAFAEMYIDSGLAALLNGTVPFFTILLAPFVLPDERITIPKALGVVLGFGGLLTLLLPTLTDGEVASDTWGILAIVGASLSYAVGMIYAKKNLTGLAPMVAPTAQLLITAVYMIPLALLWDQPWTLAPLSASVWGAWVAVAVFGTGMGFMVFYWILEAGGATALSTVGYILPLIGVVLGIIFLGESFAWNTAVATALILVGMLLASQKVRARVPHKAV